MSPRARILNLVLWKSRLRMSGERGVAPGADTRQLFPRETATDPQPKPLPDKE